MLFLLGKGGWFCWGNGGEGDLIERRGRGCYFEMGEGGWGSDWYSCWGEGKGVDREIVGGEGRRRVGNGSTLEVGGGVTFPFLSFSCAFILSLFLLLFRSLSCRCVLLLILMFLLFFSNK